MALLQGQLSLKRKKTIGYGQVFFSCFDTKEMNSFKFILVTDFLEIHLYKMLLFKNCLASSRTILINSVSLIQKMRNIFA